MAILYFPVHDSICFNIYKNRLDVALPYIKDTMETTPFTTPAAFEVEIKQGKSWGDTQLWTPD